MRAGLVFFIVVSVCLSTVNPSFASDWDKAGKALAVIEGLRILTQGNVDLIGKITGISRSWQIQAPECDRTVDRKPRHCKKKMICEHAKTPEYVWVLSMVWNRTWVPEHTEYSAEYGEIVVEGHYIKYQAENGGEWVACENS